MEEMGIQIVKPSVEIVMEGWWGRMLLLEVEKPLLHEVAAVVIGRYSFPYPCDRYRSFQRP